MHLTQNEGDAGSFVCQVMGEPVPVIGWSFNGALIHTESDINKYAISQSLLNTTTVINTLTIKNLESSDVGTYTCNATNIISSDTSFGRLTIYGELINNF